MKDAFLNHSLQFIAENKGIVSDEEKEKLAYGLEGLYLTITKLIIINLVALILGIWKEFFISLMLFNILRYPGFGFHANNSLTCLISSSILMLGIPYLMTNISLNTIAKISICIICVSCFIIYAPADTEKRPLTNKKKRMFRKVAACILAICYSIIIICLKNNEIAMLFLSGMLIETILILPITYKFFKASYRNYLKV